MCVNRRMPDVSQPLIAASDNAEAIEQGRIEARLRRLRAGAAANILTSPTGIPSTAQLGKVAP